MVGYTALMQENEQSAREKRKKLKELLEHSVESFDGKIIQYYGDGSLTIFDSAINAVHCATKLQAALIKEDINVRIGLHTGDVTLEEGIIYGDSVNITSRIEALGTPGSILVSEKVFDEIKNQNTISALELGTVDLKNVRVPMKIFAIKHKDLKVPNEIFLTSSPKATGNRLAVLPFVNMSSDPENEYFSDGITEELLNTLTKVDGLQVTSRTSVFAFKGKNEDVREIGNRLNVDKVLEGSIRKSGKRVRITAQLINARDGYHIWSETYDRDLVDIFDVQDEISGIIAGKLKENLVSPKAVTPPVRLQTHNIEAYTLYLKGLHFVNKVTPSDSRKAIECFEKVILIEPDYALCYAKAALAYTALGSAGQIDPTLAFSITNNYAIKALEIDDSLPEAYTAKACYHLYYEWNWKAAYELLQKAIDLNPNATDVYEHLFFYYISVGKKSQAVSVMEEAVRLDPLSPSVIQTLGSAYIFAERYEEAQQQADLLLDMQPEMRSALEIRAWAIGMNGNWPEALEIFREVHRLTGHPLRGLMGLGFTYAILGRREEALDCIAKIKKRVDVEPGAIVDADLVGIYAILGDLDKAFYHINECVRKRLAPVNFFLEYPLLENLKADPRYHELKQIYAIDDV